VSEASKEAGFGRIVAASQNPGKAREIARMSPGREVVAPAASTPVGPPDEGAACLHTSRG